MKTSLIELFFPRFCMGCGYIGTYLCLRCKQTHLHIKTPTCFYCGRASFGGLTHPSCRSDNGIDGCLSLYSYKGLFSKILQESKYRGAYLTLQTLLSYSDFLRTKEYFMWNTLYKPFAISVPLHPQRLKERGFNQSDLIVRSWFNTEWNPSDNILKRKIDTDHLANIGNLHSRKKHIINAFEYVGKLTHQSVVIVDDMITSGSTILECAKVLKKRGVQTVLAFSLAKG